jgi:uncharacterized protein (DUF1501 family)
MVLKRSAAMREPHHEDCGCREYRELSRREFLSTSAGASAGLAAAAIFPAWLPKVAMAESFQASRDIIVSVVQRGGADGLTTCAPVGEPNYGPGIRPTIWIRPPDDSSALRSIALDNFFAFPQAMGGLKPAYDAEDLLVVHACGQMNKSRSHFDAQRYMEVGKPADPNVITGWLGRHLALVPPLSPNAPLRALGISSGLPKSLVGAPQALPIPNPGSYSVGGSGATRAARTNFIEANYSAAAEPLRSNALNAVNTIELLASIPISSYVPGNGAVYPNTNFGRALQSVAALIRNDIGIEAAQVDTGGWDTHAQQDPNAGQMFNLMTDFSNSLGAFWLDILESGFRVTVVVVSEFGRNVRENGSNGTDHGRATTMFAMGKAIAGGRVLTASWPGLAQENLEDRQDLRVTMDHRDILAEIVQNRLGNGNLAQVFPGFTPTFRGVTR